MRVCDQSDCGSFNKHFKNHCAVLNKISLGKCKFKITVKEKEQIETVIIVKMAKGPLKGRRV